jgi:hypothetical protein
MRQPEDPAVLRSLLVTKPTVAPGDSEQPVTRRTRANATPAITRRLPLDLASETHRTGCCHLGTGSVLNPIASQLPFRDATGSLATRTIIAEQIIHSSSIATTFSRSRAEHRRGALTSACRRALQGTGSPAWRR